MVTRCPHCRELQIVDRGAFDSPLFCCPACGRDYLEKKITEPALVPQFPPARTRWENGDSLSLAVGGVLLVVAVLLFAVCKGKGLRLPILFSLLFCLQQVDFWKEVRKQKRRDAHVASIVEASRQRMADRTYQTRLLKASGYDPHLLEELKDYNFRTELDYVLPMFPEEVQQL